MFRGITAVNIDDKGRISIPARYRDSVQTIAANQLVCTIDTEEKCLLLYPLPYWVEIEQKLQALPSFNKVARRIQRLLIGHATELNMDNQGRLLLPQPLRDYANLTKETMLVGQGKKFEIWNESHWGQQRDIWLDEALTNDVDIMPQEMQSLSL